MNPIQTLINDTLALDEKANTSTGMLFFRDASPKLARIAKIAVEALEQTAAGCGPKVAIAALAAIEREAGK